MGQLFCDNKSKEIVDMLFSECEKVGVEILLNNKIHRIDTINDHHFNIHTTQGNFECESLVIACGGLSIPTMGASPFGYKVAGQFDIKVWPTRAGLVPFTLNHDDNEQLKVLSGIAFDSNVSSERKSFRENTLFTH